MKKSFMTRALAMGLSLAMAFSLSAATNVSVASAAATPAMASKQFAVRVGGAAKSYKASAATQKSFKITKATVGNTDKATVKVNSSKKSIKVTPGTVTGTTVVKVTFKNIKTAKTTAKKYRCVVKAAIEEKPEEVVNAIISATQKGVKTLVVETNFDATNSKVTVKRGTADVATDAITPSPDGKTITISTTANVVEAEYKVTVDDLEVSIKGEKSKVDKIEILGDKAAAVKVSGYYTKAEVGYKVINQFGDDITKTTSLTVNSSADNEYLQSKDHLIVFTLTGGKEFMINRDIITVTLLDQSGVSATANLAVSMDAQAKEMTFEGIYNSDGKTLTEDTDTTDDAFYLLFSAVDQYGKKFKQYKDVKEGTDLFLTVMGGLTTLSKNADGQNFIVINKGGTDYLGYRVDFKYNNMWPTAGEVSVQLLSTAGASCTGTVTVAEGNRVTDISVSSPGVIASGEKTELDFTATDAAGNNVTSYKILRRVQISTNTAYPVNWVKNLDGTGKLVLDATLTTTPRLKEKQTSMQTYTFTTQGQKFYHAQLTVTEQARPVAIDGVKSSFSTTFSKASNYVEVKLKDLQIEDQYGRIMTDSLLNAAVKNTATSTSPSPDGMYRLYRVTVNIPTTGSNVQFDGEPGLTTKYVPFDSRYDDADTTICKLAPVAGRKGDTIVEFQIENAYGLGHDKALNDATADVLFTVKDTSNVETAKVSVDDIYVTNGSAHATGKAPNYAQTVTVKSGNAQLSVADYEVSVPSDLTVTKSAVGAIQTWQVYCNASQSAIKEFANKTATTVTRKITVTLKGTGEKITTDVTLSSVAPYVKSASLYKDTYVVTTGTTPIDNSKVFDACIKELKDQYGKALVITTMGGISYKNGDACTPIITFTYTTKDSGTSLTVSPDIANNGTANAKLTPRNFAGGTMNLSFNGNIEDKYEVEINLVADHIAGTAEEDASDSFNKIVTGNADGKNAVKIIESSGLLKEGSAWSTLDDTSKLQVVNALNASTATASSIASANAIVKTYAASASAIQTVSVSNQAILKASTVTDGAIALATCSGITNIEVSNSAIIKVVTMSDITSNIVVSGGSTDNPVLQVSASALNSVSGSALGAGPIAKIQIAYTCDNNFGVVYDTYNVSLAKNGSDLKFVFELVSRETN